MNKKPGRPSRPDDPSQKNIGRKLRRRATKAGRKVRDTKRSGKAAQLAAKRRATRERLAKKARQRQQLRSRPATQRRPRRDRRPSTEDLSPEVKAEVDRIEREFTSLEGEAQLSDVFESIGEMDAKLTQLPLDLEELRQRGYVHAGMMEDRLIAFDEKWDEILPRVESSLEDHVRRLDREVDEAEAKVDRVANGNSAAISTAERAVDGLESKVNSAKSAVRGMFDDLQSELNAIEYDMNRVAWMLEQLEGSPEIELYEAEGPLLAVETEWHQDGDEGPQGILYMTDQRLLFEQKEEIVTKKRFGIFKADSEFVQKLRLEIEVHDIESVKHKEEGGFLGMGKDDILELIGSADAPVSRARFHLKGQDSSAWAAMIKRVQSGDIDEDRAEGFSEEIEAAQAVAASFPTQCPSCFAAVPEVPRGVDRITCEFCGGVITSES